MKHLNILCAAFVLSVGTLFAQVATLNEGFEGMTVGQPLQNDWKIVTPVNIAQFNGVRQSSANAHSGNNYALAYTYFSKDVTIYFITPELSTIDGTFEADFYLGAVGTSAGGTTYQIGTFSGSYDFNPETADANFHAVGNVETLPIVTSDNGETPPPPNYINVKQVIPTTTDTRVAIKVFAPSAHDAIYLDDFVWHNPTLSLKPFSIASNFAMYPNPSLTKVINLAFKNDTNKVTISSVTGQVVYNAEVSQSAQINLSHIKSGVYFVNVVSQGASVTKKLMLN